MSTMQKTKPASKVKNWSDFGETWLSCSGIHPEALTQVTPKSNKSISHHLGSTLCAPCLRQNQQVKRKNGPIWVKLGSAVHGFTLNL